MALSRAARQAILNAYLEETGRGRIVATEFLDWLEPQQDHPAWPWFFGRSDADLADAYRREVLVSRFISDLRVSVITKPTEFREVRVSTYQPAYVSPIEGRDQGGGYVPANSPQGRLALVREAEQSLQAWLRRFGGTCELCGISTDPATAQIAALAARLEKSRAG